MDTSTIIENERQNGNNLSKSSNNESWPSILGLKISMQQNPRELANLFSIISQTPENYWRRKVYVPLLRYVLQDIRIQKFYFVSSKCSFVEKPKT